MLHMAYPTSTVYQYSRTRVSAVTTDQLWSLGTWKLFMERGQDGAGILRDDVYDSATTIRANSIYHLH